MKASDYSLNVLCGGVIWSVVTVNKKTSWSLIHKLLIKTSFKDIDYDYNIHLLFNCMAFDTIVSISIKNMFFFREIHF